MDYCMIHPREMEDILCRKQAVVIDVRPCEEYRKYHFKNARNCPYDAIDVWKKGLSKNRALILYCDYGSTSLLAARMLGREGYEVYTVVGGVDAMKRFFGA